MLEVLPRAAIRVLHQDAKGHVRPAVTEFLHLWRAICDLEELAAKGVQAAVRVLASCPQRSQALLRLFLVYLEHEELQRHHRNDPSDPPIGPVTEHITRCVSMK